MITPEKLISIHALRKEGDRSTLCQITHPRYFYPRPPQGGRHDLQITVLFANIFLSTPSARRATLAALIPRNKIRQFLSTPSARRATDNPSGYFDPDLFLSTPSARRATGGNPDRTRIAHDFYPRPPQGGRQQNLINTVDIPS